MKDQQGIAWMIAGGVRAESAEDQRQRQHRLAIANDSGARSRSFPRLRERITAMLATSPMGHADSATVSADCCPA